MKSIQEPIYHRGLDSNHQTNAQGILSEQWHPNTNNQANQEKSCPVRECIDLPRSQVTQPANSLANKASLLECGKLKLKGGEVFFPIP